MESKLSHQSSNYKPSLPSLMALCATNYALSIKLLADKETVGEQRYFKVSEQLSFLLNVKEVTKYTSLIELVQTTIVSKTLSTQLTRPKIQMRLYHDAQVAEVISSQGIRQIKPRYDYPNDRMLLPDEKMQVNLFVKEWLQHCLEQGQAISNVEIQLS